ncbi:type I-E CRISPR-associated protein Cse1/CasA [Nocardiopsis lambiniae]|uniref:Type I-E CRISPR-associated protein Cse1/CasA n=1 Tax=Nocardiopsis lambiniae TaxID=3075539 RepID=A0ABU2MFG7_9ACTN|nr:type I-E CRISPR-associated protein Cse1/CasA [Nocardiopsis sp. DSM 44743]MDT0331440.1 type I-E CRISPR-associated protein Cse1/CasA [Nocardiopsis sp. DSM 44743]
MVRVGIPYPLGVLVSSCCFNLLDEPWVPVVTTTGESKLLGISDVFRNARELRCIRGESPVVTAALYRLLLAFLHRVHEGPTTERQWEHLWTNGAHIARLSDYEENYREAFWLLGGKRPFFQCPGLSEVEPKPASHLLLHRSKGNNTTLFDHTVDSDRPLLPADAAARWLVAVQFYDTGGIKTFYRGQGRKSARPSHGNLFGTVLLEGATLWETLMLNAVIYDPGAGMPKGLGDPRDCAVWEREHPPGPEPDENARARGWARLLTLPSRNVLLRAVDKDGVPHVDGVVISPGEQLDKDRLSEEPMAAFRESGGKKGASTPVRLEMLRGVWRHAADLLISTGSTSGRRRPVTIDDVHRHVVHDALSEDKEVTLRVFGQKLMSNPGAVEYWSEETLPVKLALLVAQDHGWTLDQLFGQAVKLADDIGTELQRMLRTYREELRAKFEPHKHWSFLAERYWPHLETGFTRLLHDVGDLVADREPDEPGAQDELRRLFATWGEYVRNTVDDALHTWVDRFPGGSPRQIFAVARVEMIAQSNLKKVFKVYEHETDQHIG